MTLYPSRMRMLICSDENNDFNVIFPFRLQSGEIPHLGEGDS